jgi:hypothetical protein
MLSCPQPCKANSGEEETGGCAFASEHPCGGVSGLLLRLWRRVHPSCKASSRQACCSQLFAKVGVQGPGFTNFQ